MPSFDTPVVTGLGEGARQKILIHQVFNRSVQGLTLEKNPGKRRGNKQRDKGYSSQGDAKNLRGLE
jgi:hypothetical protein